MNLMTVKSAADLPFPGVELVKTDKSITEVVVGGKLRIRSQYGLQVLTDAPLETVTRYRVTATLDGFDPKVVHFEDEYEAKGALDDFETKGATATIEKVEVQINDAGEVVGAVESAPVAKASNDLEIPF